MFLASVIKNLPDNVGDVVSIHGSGRVHGERNGNPIQYSCLENSMERGVWGATVHGVSSRSGLSSATEKQQNLVFII